MAGAVSEFFQSLGTGLGFTLVWLICLVGIVLSCVSISGTWLVALAAVIAKFLSSTDFPGWGTIAFFLILSAVVEFIEAVASSWGVKNRGGSHAAGFAALGGGLLGLFLGGFIPIPIVGSLIGMMVCSFGAAFWVENYRLKHREKAAEIAWGAVIARVLIILLKLVTTLGMVIYLIIGLILSR